MQAGEAADPAGRLGPGGNLTRSMGARALHTAAQTIETANHRRLMEISAEHEAAGPTSEDQMVPREVHNQDDMSELEDTQWSLACTQMAMSRHDDDKQLASGAHTYVHADDHRSLACTHMSTSEDECSQGARARDFLVDLSDAESVPEFLLHSTKIHAWRTGRRYGGKQDSPIYIMMPDWLLAFCHPTSALI